MFRTGYRNEAADKLIIEARAIREKAKRLELYGEVESPIIDDRALMCTHGIPMTSAATKKSKGYEPCLCRAVLRRRRRYPDRLHKRIVCRCKCYSVPLRVRPRPISLAKLERS